MTCCPYGFTLVEPAAHEAQHQRSTQEREGSVMAKTGVSQVDEKVRLVCTWSDKALCPFFGSFDGVSTLASSSGV